MLTKLLQIVLGLPSSQKQGGGMVVPCGLLDRAQHGCTWLARLASAWLHRWQALNAVLVSQGA